ncbi:unnamed protein product, partial [Meganyctiphanes norvegica]
MTSINLKGEKESNDAVAEHFIVELEQKHGLQDEEDNQFDELLKKVGMGVWQIKYIVTICFIQAFAPAQMISSPFINMPLNFRCTSTDETYNFRNSSHGNIYDNKCIYDNIYLQQEELMNLIKFNESVKKICNNFEYDNTTFISTVSSEFNLVCDKEWLSHFFQMTLMIGLTLGSLFTGLGDKWGRLIILRVAVCISLAGVLMVGFSPNYYLILLGRFLIGFFFPLMNISAYTLTMESVPPNFRPVVGAIVVIPYYISVMTIGGLSSLIRKWRIFHFIISIHIFLLGVIVFVIDESPMWLAQQGRTDEAVKGMRNAAKLNRRKIPAKKHMLKYMGHRRISIFGSTVLTKDLNKTIFESIKDTLNTFFGSQAMRIITITLPLVWLFTGIVVIGVPLNANNFTDNPFLYMVLMGIFELISSLLASFVIKRFGNIRTGIILHIGTGICLILILFLGEGLLMVKWALVMVSRVLTGVNFVIVYLMGSQLFPTIARTNGYGLCVFSMYFGFIFAAYINDAIAANVWWLFNSLCGICSFLSAGLLLLLPETQGQPLCDTVQDVNDRSQRTPKNCHILCKI